MSSQISGALLCSLTALAHAELSLIHSFFHSFIQWLFVEYLLYTYSEINVYCLDHSFGIHYILPLWFTFYYPQQNSYLFNRRSHV